MLEYERTVLGGWPELEMPPGFPGSASRSLADGARVLVVDVDPALRATLGDQLPDAGPLASGAGPGADARRPAKPRSRGAS